MALSPEVQASIVTLAGDWAVRFTNLQKARRSPKPMSELIMNNFESCYSYLTKTIESLQKP
jgi:hypothetical protein